MGEASLVADTPAVVIVVSFHGFCQSRPSWGLQSRRLLLQPKKSYAAVGLVAVASKMEIVFLGERDVVADVPAGLLEVKALGTSSGVQWVLRVCSCQSQHTGGVHLTRKMKWRVKAVGSPARSWQYPQTVAVAKSKPS